MANSFHICTFPFTVFIRRYRSEWLGLYGNGKNATPFQHPEWISAWYESFSGTYEDARVVCAFRCGVPVMAWPLVLRQQEAGKLAAACAGEQLSDYCGWLSDPVEDAAELLRQVLTHLSTEGVDQLHIADIRPGSMLHRACIASLADWASELEAGEVCPQLVYPARWEDYWNSRSRNTRQRVSRAGRAGSGAGGTRIVMQNCVTSTDMVDFMRMHLSWWRGRGRISILEYPRVRDFLMRVAKQLSGTGILLQSKQICDSAVSAMFILLQGPAVRYYYQAAINPEFAQIGSGISLMHELARSTHAEGYARLDLLRGDEHYKLQFANAASRNLSITYTL